MFEVTTVYDKEIFCKCYKVYHKIFSKYNPKRSVFLMIICFILATVSLILQLTKPDTFKTTFATVFFYLMSVVFLYSLINFSEKGIRKTVDKMLNKNTNDNLTVKYIFNEENFLSIHGENEPNYFNYDEIVHFEMMDEYIILLLRNKKTFALKSDNGLYDFLKNKTENTL